MRHSLLYFTVLGNEGEARRSNKEEKKNKVQMQQEKPKKKKNQGSDFERINLEQ